MTSSRRLVLLALFGSALALAGCGPSGPRRMAVDGSVRFHGQPLKEGTVQFDPLDPSAASSGGGVVRDGRFSIPADQGLLPGRYRVQVSAPDPKAPKGGDGTPGSVFEARELIPEQYNTRSKLTAEVKDRGPNHFEYDIE